MKSEYEYEFEYSPYEAKDSHLLLLDESSSHLAVPSKEAEAKREIR